MENKPNSSNKSQRNKSRKIYSESFRSDAIALARREGVTITQVAKDLGISRPQLSRWVSQDRISKGETVPHSNGSAALISQLREENRQLKRELARVSEEREILRKATAFFARENR